MITRTVVSDRYEAVRAFIEKNGKCAPLSLQYDVDVNANGNRYILRLQMVKKHKLVVLQAVQWWYDSNLPGGKGYKMLAKDEYLSAVLVMLMHQCSGEPAFFADADSDICEAVHTLDNFDKRYDNIMAEKYKGAAYDG